MAMQLENNKYFMALFGERINLFLEIDPSNELSTYVRVSEVQIQKDTVMRDTDTFATLTH